MNKQEAIDVVRAGLKAMSTFTTDDTVEIDETYPLMGDEGITLDSVGLTTLVIHLEEFIFRKYNKSVSIVSDKMFSYKHSPFKNVGTLAEFIMELMNE